MRLNINASAVVAYTNRLEKASKTAMPKAVARTLNDVAFDVKKNTLQKTTGKKFTIRSKNFFRVYSRVNMASVGHISSMKSEIGMTEQGLKGGNNYSVDNLEKQEKGGTITNRSLIPTRQARGGSDAKLVRQKDRLSSIRNAVRTSAQRGKNPRERWKRAAVKAGKGGVVASERGLYRINSLRRKGTTTIVKSRKLYSYEQNRKVRVRSTNFMRESSEWSHSKMEKFFIKNAERRLGL